MHLMLQTWIWYYTFSTFLTLWFSQDFILSDLGQNTQNQKLKGTCKMLLQYLGFLVLQIEKTTNYTYGLS